MNNYVDINSSVTTKYVATDQERDANIAYSINKVKDRLVRSSEIKEESLAIVCLGPSLLTEWPKLQNFKYVLSCSGAHKFLIERGIIPTWHVEVDPREHKIELLGTPHPDVEYLIASACNPKFIDYLDGYNVKLWHVFSDTNLSRLPNIYPRGDWVFTGGSNAGIRALVIGRFLGFRQIDLFGMDFSYPENWQGEHAVAHPKPAKQTDRVITKYKGRIFHTTPRMLFYAQEFFHEVSSLADVNVTLHGDGLLQTMVVNGWQEENKKPASDFNITALCSPKVITEEYRKLNQQLHEQNPSYGISGHKRTNMVVYLCQELHTTDVLDYGCGKGTLAQSLPFAIKEYDPAIPEKSQDPEPADIVICTDVLEHIEPELIINVLGDIARCTKQVAYLVIHTGPAIKTLPDGRNTHLIQQGREWWVEKLKNFFKIEDVEEDGQELQIIVRSRVSQETISHLLASMGVDDYEEIAGVKFIKLNDAVKWRTHGIKTKEPATYKWIMNLKSSDVLVDVGANIGVYSLLAAKHPRCTIYAFEPESQNFALLNQQIHLNHLQEYVQAYCLSISDHTGLGTLHLSTFDPGSSAHQLNQQIDFNGAYKELPFTQGTFSTTLDSLVGSGKIKQPTHVKIDIDGLEHLVIDGATKTLELVKSLNITVNPNIKAHLSMIEKLQSIGFVYDPLQVSNNQRKDGAFKGIAEYIFYRV